MTSPEPALVKLEDDPEGLGFQSKNSRSLPPEFLLTLQRLCAIDKLLDDFSARAIDKSEELFLSIVGQAVQHQLLSLSPWRDLTNLERKGSSMGTYEACRITAIIYSNAVIFPMSPSGKWLEKSVGELRQVLESSDMITWSGENIKLLVWVSVVGGMASFWTSHRALFVEKLRQTLKIAGVTRWTEIEDVLKRFL